MVQANCDSGESHLVLMAHAADIHLGKNFMKFEGEERNRDIELAFRQMMDLLVQEHVDLLAISGDLFERPRPNNYTLALFKEAVLEFLQKGGKILLVNGEHDTSTERDLTATDLVSRYLDGVYHLRHFYSKSEMLSIEKEGMRLNFYGLGAIRGPRAIENGKNIMRFIEKTALEENGKNIMISHISTKDYFPLADGYELASFPDGISYYALGHLHFRIIDNLKRGIVAYPGSLEILSLKEIEEWKKKGKGFYIVDLSSDEAIVHQVDLDIRPQEIFEISSAREIGELQGKIDRYLSTLVSDRSPIINILLEGDEVEILRKEIQSRLNALRSRNVLISITSRPSESDRLFEKVEGFRGAGGSNELKIMSKIVADEQIAKLIIDLKNCLSEEEKDCREIAEAITERRDYWNKAIEKWPGIGDAINKERPHGSEQGLMKFKR